MAGRERGIMLAFLAALISGASVFVNGFVVKGFDPFLFTFLKNAGAAVFLAAAIMFMKELELLKKLSHKQWMWLGAIGLVGGSIPFLLFFQGLSMLPAVKGSFLFRLLFLFSAVFAFIVLREKPSRSAVLGAAIMLIGNLLLLGKESIFSFGMGELLVLSATAIWGFEYVLSKWAMARQNIHSRLLALGRMFFGSIAIFLYLAFIGKLSIIPSLSIIHWQWVLITSAFLFMFVSSWYASLKIARATDATAILTLGGPITAALNFMFLGKLPSFNDAFGLLLIVAGIAAIVGIPQIRRTFRYSLEELRKLVPWRASS